MDRPKLEPKHYPNVGGVEILATDTPQQVREKLACVAMDAMHQRVGVLDAKGTVLEVNPAALERARATAAEVIGKPFWECFWWAASKESQEQLRGAIARSAAGEPVRFEVAIYGWAHDTETTITDFSLTPVKDAADEVVFLVAEGCDITEKKAQEREIALYRVAASFAGELDQQKLIQMVTDEATALTGAQFGAFFFNALRDDGGAYVLYTLSGAPAEAFSGFPLPRATPLFGPTFRGEGVIRLDDVRQDPRYGQWGSQPAGHLPVASYLAVPVIGREGKVLGGLFFGHGERARFSEMHERIARGLAGQAAAALEKAQLYDDLRKSEARARAADRRKDEFLAMLGHELRNPLAPIMTALELLRLRGDTSSAREQQVIARQVRHLARLVDDLLDIAQVTRGKIQINCRRINLAPVVDRAVEMASPLLEQRGHGLQLLVPRTGLMVDGDAERLAQVVANLLTNAAKYTDPGGSITLSAQRHDDRVTISVRDNGQGIAADLLPQIFDLFVQGERRSDRAPGGLGIGLALVRNIVELHGGRVEARSAGPGMGSELVIDLQAAPDAVATPQVPGPEPAPPPGRPIGRILVVDDNVDAASTLADALQMVGYEVVVAHDGPQALAAASELPATTALIDIGLPVMDGYELARLLRRQWTGQPLQLIAVTGYGQESDKENAKSAGFDAHLVKPVRLPDLLALLSPAAVQDD